MTEEGHILSGGRWVDPHFYGHVFGFEVACHLRFEVRVASVECQCRRVVTVRAVTGSGHAEVLYFRHIPFGDGLVEG